MDYQIGLPVPKETLEHLFFGFVHPALVNRWEIQAGVGGNDPTIPKNRYQVSIPPKTPIMAPVRGTVTSMRYLENPFDISLVDAHRTNYIGISPEKGLEIQILHIKPTQNIEIGTNVGFGDHVGSLHGFRDAPHLHLNITSTDSYAAMDLRNALTKAAPNWQDTKREIIDEMLIQYGLNNGWRIAHQALVNDPKLKANFDQSVIKALKEEASRRKELVRQIA